MAPGGRRRVFATFAAAAIALMQVSPQLMILDGYCTGVGVVGFRRRRRGRSRRHAQPRVLPQPALPQCLSFSLMERWWVAYCTVQY